MAQAALLFGSDGEVECLDGFWITKDVDSCDLVVRKSEPQDAEDASSGGNKHADIPIDEDGTRCSSAASGLDSFFGPSCGATGFSRNAWKRRGFVEADGEIGIKDCDESIEVGGTQSGDECVDDFALLCELCAGSCGRALDSTASATRQLARGFRRTADDFSDFIEG